MREVLDELVRWWRAGEPVGMGTVVATWRSAPRPPGAAMLVGPDGSAVGSVSGGCVEGAVYELGQQVLADDQPVQAGMAAALPHVDEFVAGHSVAAFAEVLEVVARA